MKKAELEPRWLVSLLKRWGLREINQLCGGLGYASGSSWMRGLKSSPSSSIDPTGYSAEDHSDLLAGMDWLLDDNRGQWAAICMHYKPWVIEHFKAEGFPFNPDKTYYNRLHSGHKNLAEWMDARKSERNDIRLRYMSAIASA